MPEPQRDHVAVWGRRLYMALGWLCVGLGFAGVFLPVLPTTPFLLAAAWAFGKSSPALAAWLRNHPRLGRYIRDWQDRGAIPVRAKITAVLLMTASLAFLVFATTTPVAIKMATGVILAGAGIFVVTRPSGTG